MTDMDKTAEKFVAAAEAATVALRKWNRAWSAMPPEVKEAIREADS